MLGLTTWLLPLLILFILPSVWAQGDGSCQCGVKNVQTSNDYIVGGQEADKHEYPWMVALVHRGKKSPFCGGSLITERHVLSAAHCFDRVTKDNMEVLVGLHSIHQTDFKRHEVSKIDNHRKWSDRDVDYDYSILTIHPSVRGSSLMPVCLPADTNTKYLGQKATLTGWGKVSTDGPGSPVLKEVELTVISDKVCKAKYRNVWRLDSSHICAMAPGENSCDGDSGGPLIVEENGRWTLVGVVNGGHSRGCVDVMPEIPSVYSRVTEVMNWIRKRTNGAYNSACKRVS